MAQITKLTMECNPSWYLPFLRFLIKNVKSKWVLKQLLKVTFAKSYFDGKLLDRYKLKDFLELTQ